MEAGDIVTIMKWVRCLICLNKIWYLFHDVGRIECCPAFDVGL